MASKLSLSVSQLNEYVRRMFQQDPMLRAIEVRGEISNLKFHQTGTLFFTLKDEQAAISCVMYPQDVARMQAEPFEGMRAVVSGSVGLYAKGGQYQLYATELHAQGVGVLYERLQALKLRLAAEGLFDADKKRPIPGFSDTIGVVSSPTGAVIHDILSVSLRRDPQARILLCPVRVQGVGAADEVVEALRLLEQLDNVSVIIVARGGGSIEDLWTFNEESVVRAVAACKKPVISAVGHETDVTLCDLAADLRAPTPSAAAEFAVARRDELCAQLASVKEELRDAMLARLEQDTAALRLGTARLMALRPEQRIRQEEERLARVLQALRQEMLRVMQRCEDGLSRQKRELELLSPYQVLSRGYAIVLRDDIPVESAEQLHAEESVAIRFFDGSVNAKILSEKKEEAI